MTNLNTRLLFFGTILLLFNVQCNRDASTRIAFEISEPDLAPEGIAYDAVTQQYFVSSTHKRKIVAVNRDGISRDFVPPEDNGLLGVVGMKVDVQRRLLWALSSHAGSGMPMQNVDPDKEGVSRIHKYDIESGKLISHFEIPNTQGRNFLNDLTIAQNGDIYVTDIRTKRIYQIPNKSNDLNIFYQLTDSMSPNGIDISDDQRYLFIAVYGGNNVVRIDLNTKELTALELPDSEEIAADGLYFYQNSLIAIQPWNSERIVTRYHLAEDLKTITHLSVLDNDNPHFLQPTTGVIVDGYIYCIANSQLQAFKEAYNNDDLSVLKNPVVLKIRLNQNQSTR